MIHRLYHAVTTVGRPLIGLYLGRRMARGKEDPERFAERKGVAGRPRPPGPLVWLHAASVGESLSLLPLIGRLCERPGLGLLVTTGTVTSARLMAQRLPPQVAHQYVPVDLPAYVRRFLDHWRPDLALWTESDFWPNLLGESARRGVPLVLLQGRISARSFAGWRRVPNFIRKMLSAFPLCLAQTEEDARRLDILGAREVRCLGNLKLAVPPLPCDEAELARFRAAIGGRRCWLASSTHPGEEVLAARVHQAVASAHPGLLTIIAPRHPVRGAAIAAELTAMGLPCARRSLGQLPDAGTQVYLADSMGELGLFYRLAPVAFIGKSLGAEGGQNPFEPARIGTAIVFGPRMSNFAGMAAAMLEAGAAEEVADEGALARAVIRLLADPGLAAARAAAALAWAQSEGHALDSVCAALAPFLAAAEANHARP